ncbi:MAG: hypothetical protein LBU51_06400, partial [Bacteroidales bacterium]|nr:hypothetical protein [Bacteroidales bacterium]
MLHLEEYNICCHISPRCGCGWVDFARKDKYLFLKIKRCRLKKIVYLCLKIRRTSLHCLIIKKMFPNSSTLRVFAGFEEA